MKYSIELIRLIAVVLITFTHTKYDFTEGAFHFIIDVIPRYGTLLLSIISGYLFWTVSRKRNDLFKSKVKSLLVPYLIANLLTLIPVLAAYYVFNANFLNRLSFDYTLFTDGVLALNAAPINPPTYFVRDIFIVFVLIELIMNKNLKMLFIIIPLVLFGKLFYRWDIIFLFAIGACIAAYGHKIKKSIQLVVLFSALIIFFIFIPDYSRYIIAVIVFISVIDINIKFYKTGAYSYLLHLYHAPIIVVAYPLISQVVANPYWNVVIQILTALLFSYCLYLLTRRVDFLKIMSGGR